MKKRIFKIFVLVLVFTLFIGTIKVNAARVTIVKDENPDRVDVLSLINNEFYVSIDDETKIGYLTNCVRGNEEIIGTCEILVVDLNSSTDYLLCCADENNMGTVVITITENEQIVTNVTGEISSVFYLGSSVVINE